MYGGLTLAQAWDLEDCGLLTPDESIRPLPEHLWLTAQRVWLHELEGLTPQ